MRRRRPPKAGSSLNAALARLNSGDDPAYAGQVQDGGYDRDEHLNSLRNFDLDRWPPMTVGVRTDTGKFVSTASAVALGAKSRGSSWLQRHHEDDHPGVS